MKVGDLVRFRNFPWLGVLVGAKQRKYATVWLIRARPTFGSSGRGGEFVYTYLSNLEPLNESR